MLTNEFAGRLVDPLALDAALPLYPILRVPPHDNSLRMHSFLKEAIEYARFAPYHRDLWQAVQTYAQNTLPQIEAQQWLGWIDRAFQGLHPPNPDLSDWLMIIEDYRFTATAWATPAMGQAQSALLHDLVDRYFAELNEPAFMELVQECQSRPPSAWDRRMHAAYGHVYFDREGGHDPFLVLKFANQGESLRRALAATALDHPDFPHAELIRHADVVYADYGISPRKGAPLARLSADL